MQPRPPLEYWSKETCSDWPLQPDARAVRTCVMSWGRRRVMFVRPDAPFDYGGHTYAIDDNDALTRRAHPQLATIQAIWAIADAIKHNRNVWDVTQEWDDAVEFAASVCIMTMCDRFHIGADAASTTRLLARLDTLPLEMPLRRHSDVFAPVLAQLADLRRLRDSLTQ